MLHFIYIKICQLYIYRKQGWLPGRESHDCHVTTSIAALFRKQLCKHKYIYTKICNTYKKYKKKSSRNLEMIMQEKQFEKKKQ